VKPNLSAEIRGFTAARFASRLALFATTSFEAALYKRIGQSELKLAVFGL
jgi:hypothetical protein